MCARGWAGACAGGVRFLNSNRIIPSDYRILLLLKMPIPTIDIFFKDGVSKFLAQVHMRPKANPVCLKAQCFVVILSAHK